MAVTDSKPAVAKHELPDSDLAHKREMGRRLDAVIKRGEVEWVGEVTLSTGTTSTTFTDERVSTDSQVSLHPMTPEAAALLGKCWIGSVDLAPGTAYGSTAIGQITIRHPVLVSGVVATFRSSTKG